MTDRLSACQKFADRLQQCADERRSAAEDAALISHARSCPDCRADLDAWMRLETALLPSTIHPFGVRPRRPLASPAWSVAVAVMVVIAAGTYHRINGSGAMDGSNVGVGAAEISANEAIALSPAFSDRVQVADLDPALWWNDVRNRDWVGQTMPAIESVQQGVAPLGRTLMRAVTILTTGGPLPGEPVSGVGASASGVGGQTS